MVVKHQLFWVIALLLLLCQCLTVVTAARTLGLGKACRPTTSASQRTCQKGLFCNTTTQRCARLGGLGAPCKRASTDCKLLKGDAVCYQQRCYGNTARPKLAPCKQDTHCATGYCGSMKRCALQHAEGNYCRRPQQCRSGKCDTSTAKCVAADATTTTSTSSTTTPSASSTPASVAAKAARSAATPNANSRAFTTTSSRALLQRPGQVKTLGNVDVVSPTSANAAIRLVADSAHPAVVQQVLDTPLKTGSSSKPIALTFHYLVTALQAKANGSGGDGQCSIVPFVNDVELTPFEAINADNQAGTATFTYTGAGPVTSYALSVVCDGVASTTTVDIDTVSIAVIPPTSSINLSNSDFETGTLSDTNDWTAIADGQSTGAITSNAPDVHTGMYAYQCTVATKGDRCGLRRSVSAASLTTNGAKYDYTFWAKSTSLNAQYTCTAGTSTATYFNNVADQVSSGSNDDDNGFRQYVATFTLGDDIKSKDNVDLQCFTTDVGTYAFDDFALSQAAPTSSNALPTGKCRGLGNCGFEDIKSDGALTVIDANDNTDARAQCVKTSENEFVRSGQSAELCTITPVSANRALVYLEGGKELTYIVGASYVWTFWVQLSNGATAQSLACNVWSDDGNGAVAFKGTCPLTTAKAVNGFRQVAVAFVAPSSRMSVFIAMKDVGRYAFDDVSMLYDDNGAMAMAIEYDPATTPLGSTTSDLAFTQTCTGGLTNCGFETGFANGYALQFGSSSSCVVTPRSSPNVHDGKYALQCDTTAEVNTPLQITPQTTTAGVVAGMQYTFSVWCKTTTASGGNSISAIVDGVPMPMPAKNGGVADANGFVQYAVTYTASTDTDQPSLAVQLTTPDVYYIDSFSFAIVALPSVPVADCTYLPDCDFEQTYDRASNDFIAPYFVSSGRASFYPINQAESVISGLWASQISPTSSLPGYLESDTSVGSATAYVVGADYVWTFWMKTSTVGLQCVVWAKNGRGAVAYRGTCPVTTAPSVNGFRQVAIPFTASDTQMDVMIITTESPDYPTYGQLAVDDFSILKGRYATQYDTSAGPSLTIGSADTTIRRAETCSGFTNCGFETGISNGLGWNSWEVPCQITSDAANVFDGKFALECSDAIYHYVTFEPLVSATTLRAGNDYTFSFWIKIASGHLNGINPYITAVRASDGGQLDYSSVGLRVITASSTATKGFTQLGATFSMLEDAMPLHFGFDAPNGYDDAFYLDKFDLTSVPTPP